MKIIIDGPAVGKGRPRASSIGGKARLYTPKQTRDYETHIKALAHAAMFGKAPADGPLQAEIWIMVAPPSSMSKKKQRMAMEGDLLPTSKPDVDNVSKIVLDALNGIAYLDDKQVTDLIVRRRYAPKDSVLVIISPTFKGGE